MFIYFWERGTQSVSRGATESEAGSRPLSCPLRVQCRAWTQELQDHDLSWSRMLNRLSHPGAPHRGPHRAPSYMDNFTELWIIHMLWGLGLWFFNFFFTHKWIWCFSSFTWNTYSLFLVLMVKGIVPLSLFIFINITSGPLLLVWDQYHEEAFASEV